jgi:hypothetical protein
LKRELRDRQREVEREIQHESEDSGSED